MRRIAIINQKGGVGKTTTAVNLGAALARLGRRVLLIDMDPQANASTNLAVEVRAGEPSTYGVLVDSVPVADAVRATSTENLSILPAHIDLSGAELELASAIGRETILADALDDWVRARTAALGEAPVDYVLIDNPPSLGLLSINGLAAADEVLIAVQTEFFALQGLTKLVEVVQLLRRRVNPRLEITGVLACLYDSRLRLAREVLAELRAHFPAQTFRHAIRQNVKLAECPSFSQTIFEYAPDSNGAKDHLDVARELLAREAGANGAAPAQAEEARELDAAGVEVALDEVALDGSPEGASLDGLAADREPIAAAPEDRSSDRTRAAATAEVEPISAEIPAVDARVDSDLRSDSENRVDSISAVIDPISAEIAEPDARVDSDSGAVRISAVMLGPDAQVESDTPIDSDSRTERVSAVIAKFAAPGDSSAHDGPSAHGHANAHGDASAHGHANADGDAGEDGDASARDDAKAHADGSTHADASTFGDVSTPDDSDAPGDSRAPDDSRADGDSGAREVELSPAPRRGPLPARSFASYRGEERPRMPALGDARASAARGEPR